MPTLVVNNLKCHALGPVDLRLEAGECIALSGPSGAGKTLLLRALCDLEPHAGEVFLDGRECADVLPQAWRRQIGLLPAESRWWHDTVRPHFVEVDADLLTVMGFDETVLDLPVGRLSTGERQRLALLRLLGNRPRVLLLDEPTANLDPHNSRKVEALVKQYRKRYRAAVIWVAHDLQQGLRVASRRFVMKAGRLSAGD